MYSFYRGLYLKLSVDPLNQGQNFLDWRERMSRRYKQKFTEIKTILRDSQGAAWKISVGDILCPPHSSLDRVT